MARRALKIPQGAGILFGQRARRRLALAVLGSIGIAAIEVLSVMAVLPLMQLLTGGSPTQGAPGRVAGVLGITDARTLAIVLALGVLGGFLTKGLLTLAFKWWLTGVLMRQQVDTSRQVLTYFLTGPYSLHQKRPTGELIRNCTESVGRVYASVAMGSINIITEAVTITAVVVLLVVVAPLPSVMLVLYFGLAALAFARLTQPRLKRNGEIIHLASVDVFSAAVNALGGVKEIKLRSNYDFFLDRFVTARMRIARAERGSIFLSELPRYAMEIIFILGLSGLVALVFSTNPSDTALSMVALFAAAGYRTMPSIVRLLATLGLMRGADRPLVDLVDDLHLAQEWSRVPRPGPHAMKLESELTVSDVRFTYPGSDSAVLQHVSLTVPAGTSVALVGGSGAGKTTLVDLILGMHTPSSGEITSDGVAITDDLPAWRAGIGLVPQEVWFTDGTLRENIAFGVERDQVDEAALEVAVTQAELVDLVASLPDGLDTEMGERGARLSGGQRQRIGIARALYARPQLLVLDEATSALDNITERKVTKTIERLSGSLTMVVVAHRLSTVRQCDQLVLLRDGAVAAHGAFDEVARVDPEFGRMVELGSLAPLTASKE